VVGAGAHIGARVVLGPNSSVERKASVQTDVEVSTLHHVSREGA
jgi:UDP-3-O-[3-hydroxymyristoyl] glucosamine N-acyltransferase